MSEAFRRKLPLEGVRNFRDFGGYKAKGGQMVTGRFYRSAHHALASDADLEALERLRIAAIVDLRRPEERERLPSRRWTGFQGVVVENHDNDEGAGPESWQGFMEQWDLSPEGIRNYHHRYYERAVTLPRLLDLYHRYFQVVADGDGAVVVHCAAGKDRTGIIVALTHLLAGVHRDDIIEDYLLTNDPAAFATHAPVWAEEIAKQRGRAPSMEAMEVAMGVEAEYLDRALGVVEKTYGGVEGYFSDALKIRPETRARLERRLFG